MKILVTGGAGFIGSHLVDYLIEQRHRVVVIDNLSTGRKKNLNRKAKFYQLDIQNSRIGNIFKKEKFNYVFHLAAQMNVRKSVADPIFDAKVNIIGTLNLLENSRQYGIKKFIFASTGGAIYGETNKIPTPEFYLANPLSPYGIAKLAVEKYLYYYYEVFKQNYTILRYANVYGPRQNPYGEAGVVAIFTSKVLKGEQPLINGDGKQTRDYVYVADVVKATAIALKKRGNIFNIGTGKETSVIDLFKKICQLGNFTVKEKYGPTQKGELQRSCLDCTKIKKEWGFKPAYNLEKGLRETILWFRSNLR